MTGAYDLSSGPAAENQKRIRLGREFDKIEMRKRKARDSSGNPSKCGSAYDTGAFHDALRSIDRRRQDYISRNLKR